MKKKVMVLANNDVGLYNFRKELLQRFIEQGYEVILSLPYGKRVDDLIAMGCRYEQIEMNRHGKNPFQEILLIKKYKALLKSYTPDVVLTYTIKPNIYGTFAAGACKIPCIMNVTGLGTGLENKGVLSSVIRKLYERAIKKAAVVFFQNESNMKFFDHIRSEKFHLIPGSGVNLKLHTFEAYPEDSDKTEFLFVGRLMKDKGVLELVEAARQIKAKYANVDFKLVGFCEKDFEEQLHASGAKEVVELCGQQDDVHSYMKQADAIILPSYHEGMANVLLEAAATGRPVLASNVPGCIETFDEGISGLGFAPRDADSLVAAIEKFLNMDYSKKCDMGLAGRKKMESQFDRNIIIQAYMKEIEKMEEK